MTEVLVDGHASDRIPVDDRGFLYGDGLFETIAFVGERAPLWARHMARLACDARRLMMPPPDIETLAGECWSLAAGHDRCVIRISLTRGSGGRAYTPPERPATRRILARRPWPIDLDRQRRDGIELHTSPVRLAVGGELAGIKHGNRLEQVLAAEHARRAGVDEALLFDVEGNLVESVSANLIFRLDGALATPPLDRSGVSGVGLAWLRESARETIATRRIGTAELERIEGLMVINSVAGIRPARRLDGHILAIDPACRGWQRQWDRLFQCAD